MRLDICSVVSLKGSGRVSGNPEKKDWMLYSSEKDDESGMKWYLMEVNRMACHIRIYHSNRGGDAMK